MTESIGKQIRKINKKLSAIQKKQIPFATSLALNDVAFESRKNLRYQIERRLNKPTKFSINAFQVERAIKRNLQSVVFVEEKRAYLLDVIEGRRRTSSDGRGVVGVPVNAPLNQYGNIKGRKSGLIKKATQFEATIRGIHGIWERQKGRGQLRLMVRFHASVQHKERFPFHSFVYRSVRFHILRAYRARLLQALSTAR